MNYLKVLGAQLEVKLDCNSKNEFLIPTREYIEQLQEIKKIITKKDPDVIILPEMCYQDKEYSYWLELSKNKLIIAGSIYRNGINKTAIFDNQKSFFLPKNNASGSEPMIRNILKTSKEEFLKNKLKDYTFKIQGKNIIILNCMDYYQYAYYIARTIPNVFAIICLASNNNPQVFLYTRNLLY